MASIRYEILEQDRVFSDDLKATEEVPVLQRSAKGRSYSGYLIAVVLFLSLAFNLFHYAPRSLFSKTERNYGEHVLQYKSNQPETNLRPKSWTT